MQMIQISLIRHFEMTKQTFSRGYSQIRSHSHTHITLAINFCVPPLGDLISVLQKSYVRHKTWPIVKS